MVQIIHAKASRQTEGKGQREARRDHPLCSDAGRKRRDSRQGQSSGVKPLGLSSQISSWGPVMAQQGFVFRKGSSWFLRYRHDVSGGGTVTRKQKCVKLAD